MEEGTNRFSEEPEAGGPEEGREIPTLARGRLLGFYDRLRERLLAATQGRGGRLGERTVELLLLAPDLFILLARVALDPAISSASRRLAGGVLAYFLLPIDLLPEGLLGPAGWLEDLALTAAVVGELLAGREKTRVEAHWSGGRELGEVLRRVALGSREVLSGGLQERLRALLARRGVRWPRPDSGRDDA